MRTRKQYQEYLNNISDNIPRNSFWLAGKLRKGLYGNLLRKHDPIAFEVGMRDRADTDADREVKRTDRERLDWMEDKPSAAVEILIEEAKSNYGHLLRERIDEAMDKSYEN